MDHTAEEIVRIALEQQKQIDDGSWAMFEVIAKGELRKYFKLLLLSLI